MLDKPTIFIISYVAATALLVIEALFTPAVGFPVLLISPFLLVIAGVILLVPSGKRLQIGSIAIIGLIVVGVVIPFGLEEVALRFEIGGYLFIGSLTIGILGALMITLETIRRLFDKRPIHQESTS